MKEKNNRDKVSPERAANSRHCIARAENGRVANSMRKAAYKRSCEERYFSN